VTFPECARNILRNEVLERHSSGTRLYAKWQTANRDFGQRSTTLELRLFGIDPVFRSTSKLHRILGSARIHVNTGQGDGQVNLFVI